MADWPLPWSYAIELELLKPLGFYPVQLRSVASIELGCRGRRNTLKNLAGCDSSCHSACDNFTAMKTKTHHLSVQPCQPANPAPVGSKVKLGVVQIFVRGPIAEFQTICQNQALPEIA